MMVNIKFYGYTDKKVKFVYKILNILLQSVPYAIKEDIRDVLFDLALDLIQKPDEYIFAALRNKKSQLLKKSAIKNNVLNGSLVLLDKGDETDHCHKSLFLMEDFNIIFIAYTKFTISERRFFNKILWCYNNKKAFTWADVSYFTGFSKPRGSKVKSSIQRKIEDVKQTKGTKLLRELRTVGGLQRAIREFDKN